MLTNQKRKRYRAVQRRDAKRYSRFVSLLCMSEYAREPADGRFSVLCVNSDFDN